MYNTLMADQQPGEVIIPIERNEPAAPAIATDPTPPYNPITENGPATIPPPTVSPTPTPIPQVSAPVEPVVAQVSQPQAVASEPAVNPFIPKHEPTAADDEGITWQSAEYMTHDKDSSWYGAMVLGSILISAVVYILNRDIITAAIILFALVGLTYFSGRKPREQQFAVSAEGVQVGHNFYAFHDFRSFSVAEEPSSISIVLMPLKRFMPAVNIFVPADYEEKVVNFISEILPIEQHKPDVVDNLMRRIRF